MSGSGNPNGKTSNKWRSEHLVSRLLHEAGVNRKSMRLRLGIKSPQYYHKCMTNPAEHLSVNQLSAIGDVIDKPLLEVLGIVLGKNSDVARKWYDQDHPTTL